MTASGKFNKYVAVQSNNGTSSGDYNEFTDNWETDFNVYCSINTPSAKDASVNKDIQVDSVVIMTWIEPTINFKQRIVHGSDIYEIQTVIPVGSDQQKIIARRIHE